MELREWLELAFIGLMTLVGGWFKSEHSRIKQSQKDATSAINDLKTKFAVMEELQKSNKEHMDRRFDALDANIEKLFNRFERYDRDREDFFKNFDLTPKK